MNAANESQLKPPDPAVTIIKEGMTEAFVNGFECGKNRACIVLVDKLGLKANDLVELIQREQAPELPR